MLSSLLLSIVFLLPNIAVATAPQWTDASSHLSASSHNTYNGTAYNATADHGPNSNITTHLPGSQEKPHWDEFHIRIARYGRRYQTSKRYWAFSANDAVVTDSFDDAAKFHFDFGYLKCDESYVSLDSASGYSVLGLSKDAPNHDYKFWKGDNGALGVSGDSFTVGKGRGIFCASDDGNVFVIGSKKPSFRCQGLDLRSNEPTTQRLGKKPASAPGNRPQSPSHAGTDHTDHSDNTVDDGTPRDNSNPKPTPVDRPSSHQASPLRPIRTLVNPFPDKKPNHDAQPSNDGHSSNNGDGSDHTNHSNHGQQPHDDQPSYDNGQDDHDSWDNEPTPTENDWQDSDTVHATKPDPSADLDLDDKADKVTHLPEKILDALVSYWGDAE